MDRSDRYRHRDAGQQEASVDDPPLQDWIAQDPRRRCVHLDFGTRWIDPATPKRYQRLSWIPGTGELYVTDAGESSVRVLCTIREKTQLQHLLVGWADVCSGPSPSLRWVERRLVEWAPFQLDA